jgi:hypothetical protein
MRYLLAFLLLMPLAAHAAKQVTLTCTPPTTRVDGSVFSAAEIGSYLFQMTQPNQPLQALGAAPTCSYVVSIAPNTCIKGGTVFGASVSDKLGVWSDPGTATLAADACNALPKPAKPTVTITVQ